MCFSCVRMKFVVFIKFNEINRSNDDAGTTNTITNIQCIFSVALIYVHATKRQKKMHLNFCVRLIKANHHFNRFMTFVRQAELSRIIVAHCMEYFLLLLHDVAVVVAHNENKDTMHSVRLVVAINELIKQKLSNST